MSHLHEHVVDFRASGQVELIPEDLEWSLSMMRIWRFIHDLHAYAAPLCQLQGHATSLN
jgi:hypothetical protein